MMVLKTYSPTNPERLSSVTAWFMMKDEVLNSTGYYFITFLYKLLKRVILMGKK